MGVLMGIKVVYGIPETIKPIQGLPAGKARLRLRPWQDAKVFVKTGETITEHIIIENSDGSWTAEEIERNITIG